MIKEITIKELTNNYINNGEAGVIGYDGKLNIRPAFQREFIYKAKEQKAVVKTLMKGLPLGLLYWSKNANGTYEIIDGQQRTISICEYVKGEFSNNYRYFHNLTEGEQEQILNYKILVHIFEGSEKEKLEWFETINIAGKELTKQELRNAIYNGTWLNNAKKYFSKTGCPAYNIAKDYIKGSPIRQDYLETAIKWLSNGAIRAYMSANQHKSDARELWNYFENIINWTKLTFINYRKEIKGIDLGFLYDNYKDAKLDPKVLESEIKKLMEDDDVTNKKGIFTYVLTKEEKLLNIRAFTPNQKREAFERQKGICVKCNETFELEEMEADHITPWSEGGNTNSSNCQLLCKKCNRVKSNK